MQRLRADQVADLKATLADLTREQLVDKIVSLTDELMVANEQIERYDGICKAGLGSNIYRRSI